MKRRLSSYGWGMLIVITLFIDCKSESKAPVTIGITDSRDGNTGMPNKVGGIIDPGKLTKFQIAVSSIQLQQNDGDYIDVLDNGSDVDLMQFRGTVKDLSSVEIPAGSYSSIKVGISGASITYDGNNYTASTSSGATATMEDHPGMTFTEQQGVPNIFASGEIIFELSLMFEITNKEDAMGIRLFYDAEPSCYEIPFVCPICGDTHTFAGARPIPHVGVILEQGIQQIKHSPPLGIEPASETDVNYYGIHTFIDFNSVGGKINLHTSQHVFRGEDGTLIVDAEPMAENPNLLIPDTVAASGTTDIRADETFRCVTLKNNLASQGYTLESGKLYYFSLRKTWHITTGGNTYDLTRICEPIPVLWP